MSPTDLVMAERARCARIAIDISRAKLEQARIDGAPPTYLAGVEATGTEIEHAIMHPEAEGPKP